jgi:hypothetical protein
MSFFQKYELLRLLNEGEAKTFKALERATGRHVLFHMLPGEQRSKPGSLLEKVERLRGSPSLIEVGEFASSPYVVTEYTESCTKLSEWVDQQSRSGAAVNAPVAPPIERPSPVAPPPPPFEAPPPVVSPAPPAQPEMPGEFTRLFENQPGGATGAAVAAAVRGTGRVHTFVRGPPRAATAAPSAGVGKTRAARTSTAGGRDGRVCAPVRKPARSATRRAAGTQARDARTERAFNGLE